MTEEIQESQPIIQAPVTVEERKVNPPTIAILLIAILLFGIGGVYAGIQIGKRQMGSGLLPKITPTTVPQPTKIPDETTNWKTYANTDLEIEFKYPSSWNLETPLLSGSGMSQEMKDPDGLFLFTFATRGNYSQMTGKPYNDLYEFAKIPYKVRERTVAGQNAIQVLPRAGGETENSVDFFSKDLKFIISLNIETPKDGSKIEEGQQLFDQILSTFKFLD